MAGVHSPSDAFAHLQHHQHNGLLGPSMQVREPHSSLMRHSASPASASCSPPPPPFLPSHSYTLSPCHVYTLCSLSTAWFTCVPSAILACAASYLLTTFTSLKLCATFLNMLSELLCSCTFKSKGC